MLIRLGFHTFSAITYHIDWIISLNIVIFEYVKIILHMNVLYESCPSYIPNFGLKIRNFLSGSPIVDTKVRPWLFLSVTPWNFKNIPYMNPFTNFDKSNTTPDIYLSLFAFHRSQYHKYIDIYTDGSKINNLVGCGSMSVGVLS